MGGEKEGSGDVHHLQEKVRVLTEEKRTMETQLEAFRQAGKDEREKAEILAAEKKYRTQVCFFLVWEGGEYNLWKVSLCRQHRLSL